MTDYKLPDYRKFQQDQKKQKKANNPIGDVLSEFNILKKEYKEKPSQTKLMLLKQKQKRLKKKGILVKMGWKDKTIIKDER